MVVVATIQQADRHPDQVSSAWNSAVSLSLSFSLYAPFRASPPRSLSRPLSLRMLCSFVVGMLLQKAICSIGGPPSSPFARRQATKQRARIARAHEKEGQSRRIGRKKEGEGKKRARSEGAVAKPIYPRQHTAAPRLPYDASSEPNSAREGAQRDQRKKSCLCAASRFRRPGDESIREREGKAVGPLKREVLSSTSVDRERRDTDGSNEKHSLEGRKRRTTLTLAFSSCFSWNPLSLSLHVCAGRCYLLPGKQTPIRALLSSSFFLSSRSGPTTRTRWRSRSAAQRVGSDPATRQPRATVQDPLCPELEGAANRTEKRSSLSPLPERKEGANENSTTKGNRMDRKLTKVPSSLLYHLLRAFTPIRYRHKTLAPMDRPRHSSD